MIGLIKHSLLNSLNSVSNVIYESIPDNKFKNYLQAIYRTQRSFYSLNEFVADIKLFGEDILFVELRDGTKFYGSRDTKVLPMMKYLNYKKLGKLSNLEDFGSFFVALYDQYMMGVNEKYYNIKRDDIIIDVGAHIGTFTVRVAKIVGNEGKVIAIEPELKNVMLLQNNININKLQNVVVVPNGIWSKEGVLKLYLNQQTWGHSYLLHNNNSSEYIETKVDTLDDIINKLNIDRVNFIKMDIEGAEIEALKGMDETLKMDISLAIEIHGKQAYKMVTHKLEDSGFIVERRITTLFAKKKKLRNV